MTPQLVAEMLRAYLAVHRRRGTRPRPAQVARDLARAAVIMEGMRK